MAGAGSAVAAAPAGALAGAGPRGGAPLARDPAARGGPGRALGAPRLGDDGVVDALRRPRGARRASAALTGSGVGAGVDVGATLATGSGTTSGSAAEPPRLPLSRLTAITSSAMPAHEYSPSSTTGLPNGPRRLRGGRPTA